MKLQDLFEAGPPIDNVRGLGAVGASSNIDYLGLRVLVKPSVFLQLATPHPDPRSDYIEQHIAAGEPIGAPFLDIHIPQEWFSDETDYKQVVEGDLTKPARIVGHEGRHRMTAILKHYGDDPVETHILLGGLRRRHLTDNMIARLNESIVSQTCKLVRGPWFDIVTAITEIENQHTLYNNNATLASMVARDQAERNAYKKFVQTKANGDYEKGAELYAKFKKRSNNDIFGELASQHKFMSMQFDFDTFTESDWHNYWLMAQHCDSNRNFQKNALAAIAKYQGKDNDNYRYLYDRISCGTTGTQKYGTQQECSIDSVNDVQHVTENFADGKGPGKPGDSRRHGIPKGATLAQLDKIGKGSGRKAQLARWQANMRRGRKKTKESLYEHITKTDIISFGEGDVYILDHFFDRAEERGVSLRSLAYMFKYTMQHYTDQIANLGETGFVIRSKNGTGIAILKQEMPDNSYRYVIKTVHPTLRRGADEPEFMVGDNKYNDTINEAIAPHGSPENEFELMKAGTKPAALVGPVIFQQLYKPLADQRGWPYTQINIPSIKYNNYVVGQPGEEKRVQRLVTLVQDMNANFALGIKPDREYHIEMGRLLGYSDQDIRDFLKKINLAESQTLRGAALTVFDIDETLFHTKAKILVIKDNKVVKELDNREFNNYKLEQGESFDFSQFRDAKFFNATSIPIEKMWQKAKSTLDTIGRRPGSKVIIVTARSDFDDRETFLDTFRKHGLDIDKIHVHRAGNLNLPSGEAKKIIIGQYLETGEFDMVRLFDDAEVNLKSFLSLKQDYPDIMFKAYMVLEDGSVREYNS